MSAHNIGPAILLVGMSYLGLQYGFSWWIVALMVLAASAWGWRTFSKEGERIVRAQARYWEAKAKNEEVKTQKKEGGT